MKEINERNLKRLFPHPIPPKDISLKFIVNLENNGRLVKNYFSGIQGWTESELPESMLFNFKWTPTSSGVVFSKLGEYSTNKQLVNHFENHSVISNKVNLFLNMLKYCEVSF